MSADSDPGHGSSPAAWTAVTIILIAVLGGAVAFWFEAVWVVAACAVLVGVGVLVGLLMAKAGYGVRGPKWQPKSHAAADGSH